MRQWFPILMLLVPSVFAAEPPASLIRGPDGQVLESIDVTTAPAGVYTIYSPSRVVNIGGDIPIPGPTPKPPDPPQPGPEPLPPPEPPTPETVSAAIVLGSDKWFADPGQAGAILASPEIRGLMQSRTWVVLNRDARDETDNPPSGSAFWLGKALPEPTFIVSRRGEKTPLLVEALKDRGQVLSALDRFGVKRSFQAAPPEPVNLDSIPAAETQPANTFGCLPLPLAADRVLPAAGAVTVPLPPLESLPSYATILPPDMLAGLTPKIFDQGNRGSCAAQGVTMGLMALLARQGYSPVILSPGAQYSAVAWPRDNGSTIYENIERAASYGIPPASVVGEQYWGNPRNFENKAADCSKGFRLDRFMVLDGSADEMYDLGRRGLAAGYPLYFGINWPGGGGHAILGVGYVGDDLLIQNSWGEDWGDRGLGKLTRRQCKSMPNYGAALLISAVYPSAGHSDTVKTAEAALESERASWGAAP